MKKRAFTLAEAILTMTILGIIAAVMVTTLKPAQYRTQAFNTLKKKVYAELDSVTQTVLVECAKNMSTTSIFKNCTRTSTTHTFGTLENAIYGRYMRGSQAGVNAVNDTTCLAMANYSSLKLKNGVCVYFGANSIRVDVNGNEGPNESGNDNMALTIDNDGISTTMDTAMTTGYTP